MNHPFPNRTSVLIRKYCDFFFLIYIESRKITTTLFLFQVTYHVYLNHAFLYHFFLRRVEIGKLICSPIKKIFKQNSNSLKVIIIFVRVKILISLIYFLINNLICCGNTMSGLLY